MRNGCVILAADAPAPSGRAWGQTGRRRGWTSRLGDRLHFCCFNLS
ncbi:unnamed protein product [Gulo gulo]|uniref:Uncharacterized protein n=1 Tax=Gulo gulo TaxID=48420 RepID=A0A9X9M577_GULGU|nr:unnamed protein product [Gulo gulo]